MVTVAGSAPVGRDFCRRRLWRRLERRRRVTYLGKAGQGVTGLLYGDYSQFLLQLGGATFVCVRVRFYLCGVLTSERRAFDAR